MGSNPEKTNMVGQVGQTGQGGHVPAVPVGGTGDYVIVPVPPPVPALSRPYRQDLEAAALAAHAAGTTWPEFWPSVASAVAAAEPWDNAAYRRLVARLGHLVTCGDMAGIQPIDTGWERPAEWELSATEAAP